MTEVLIKRVVRLNSLEESVAEFLCNFLYLGVYGRRILGGVVFPERRDLEIRYDGW